MRGREGEREGERERGRERKGAHDLWSELAARLGQVMSVCEREGGREGEGEREREKEREREREKGRS